jgi:hypothetical protein
MPNLWDCQWVDMVQEIQFETHRLSCFDHFRKNRGCEFDGFSGKWLAEI